jgi:hypothetical protein
VALQRGEEAYGPFDGSRDTEITRWVQEKGVRSQTAG